MAGTVSPCLCHGGTCHACGRRNVSLHTCAGCQHKFCYYCMHRLNGASACIRCAHTFLDVLTQLDMSPEVEHWINHIQFS